MAATGTTAAEAGGMVMTRTTRVATMEAGETARPMMVADFPACRLPAAGVAAAEVVARALRR
jgi:hypothetical protein